MLLSFGAQAAIARQLFSSPDARRSVANRLLSDRATTRLVEIARGIAPEPGAPRTEPSAEAVEEDKPAKKTRAKKAKAEGDEESEAAAPKRSKKKAEPQPESEDSSS
jgi:hypothetical protein